MTRAIIDAFVILWMLVLVARIARLEHRIKYERKAGAFWRKAFWKLAAEVAKLEKEGKQ